MIRISNMTETDIPFAKSLTDIEGWGYRDSDFRRLIALGPDRCFVAWKGRDPTGTVTTTLHGDYAFIGTLIVKHDAREEGIGRALMEKAIDRLFQKGATTIELDAVISVVPMYRKLSFEDKYLSLRLRRAGGGIAPGKRVKMEPPRAREIIDFDRKMIGMDRGKLIRRYLDEFGASFHVLSGRGVRGYAVVKERAGGVLMIGPFVADGLETAKRLLGQLLERYHGRVLTIGLPAVNVRANSMFLEAGFVNSEPSLRMYLGKRMSYEGHMYGIASPEKG